MRGNLVFYLIFTNTKPKSLLFLYAPIPTSLRGMCSPQTSLVFVRDFVGQNTRRKATKILLRIASTCPTRTLICELRLQGSHLCPAFSSRDWRISFKREIWLSRTWELSDIAEYDCVSSCFCSLLVLHQFFRRSTKIFKLQKNICQYNFFYSLRLNGLSH